LQQLCHSSIHGLHFPKLLLDAAAAAAACVRCRFWLAQLWLALLLLPLLLLLLGWLCRLCLWLCRLFLLCTGAGAACCSGSSGSGGC
jgi:hypothetical protein